MAKRRLRRLSEEEGKCSYEIARLTRVSQPVKRPQDSWNRFRNFQDKSADVTDQGDMNCPYAIVGLEPSISDLSLAHETAYLRLDLDFTKK